MSGAEEPPFPLGVPTACFVHLDDGPNPSATAATDSGGGKVSIDGRPHEVDRVFDARLDKDDEVFQEMLQVTSEDSHRPVPLTTFVEDAVSVCMIVAGTNQSGKRLLYQGPEDADESLGMLGWVFDPVFQLLRDKAFGMQGFYEFKVEMEFYEIFDEMVTDLLCPDNQDLQVRLHPLRGFEVEGMSRSVITSPSDGRRAIQAGKRNRMTQVLPNGPAPESASAVLHVSLTQREGESPEQYTHLQSTMYIVEVPSTHKLVSSPDDLRLTQGPTLNRSLLAFKEVCKALSSEKQIRFAPFGESKLTEVLQGSLGGNAIVLCIACLSRSDSIKVNTVTLSTIQNLQAAMHYPVANTELIQGLVMKYHFMLANLLDGKGGAGGRGAGGGGADAAMNSQRMRALEGQVLQAKMESNESKEDAAKVYKMLELFKAKYVKLVETKAAQSKDLISAEEGKLEVSRSLLDLKLEYSKLQEGFETDRYALTTDVLAAKNEVVELEMRLQESEAGLDAKQKEAAAALSEREAMQDKLTEAEKRVKELQDGFGVEEAKSIEMGTELLTLVNQKAHLEKVREDLDRQVEDFSARLRMLELDLRASQDEARLLNGDLHEARKKTDMLEIAKAKAELELQQVQVQADKRILENDRTAVAGEHEREAELLKNHMHDLGQLTKLKGDNEALQKAQEHLSLEVKQTERKYEQSQEEVSRKVRDVTEAQRELAEAQEELANLRNKFRDKLGQLVGPDASKGGRSRRRRLPSEVVSTEADAEDHGPAAQKRAALEEIISSYKDREEKAMTEAEGLRSKAREAAMKNRALHDRYKQLRGIIEDSVGAQELPPDLPDDDLLIAAGAMTTGSGGGADNGEIIVLKERLRLAASELSTQQEKNVNIAEKYSELVATLEQKQREDALQLGRLETENESLKRQVENNQAASGGGQLQAMQAMMEKMALSSASAVPAPKAESGDMWQRIRQAESERDKALDEVAQFRRFKGSGGVSGTNKALAMELENAERRNAELVSSNTTLAAELTNFRNYMRDAVARYQTTVTELQAELRRARASSIKDGDR